MESTGGNNMSYGRSDEPKYRQTPVSVSPNLLVQDNDHRRTKRKYSSTSDESDSTEDELLDQQALNEDYGESVSESDDNYDSELEYGDDSPVTISRGSDKENIVFEETLKHSSFFESVRERRHMHLENRLRGTMPMLHFTGSHRTDFWGRYGIEPTKIIPPGNIHGVPSMLTKEEFNKLGSTERRLHVNGQKFKVVANQSVDNSLYRAIAQALGIPEDEFDAVHDAILHELTEQWPVFCNDVCAQCGKNDSDIEAQFLDSRKIIEKYKKYTAGNLSPPSFELVAAGLHFGFSFSIIELTGLEQPVSVKNCINDRVLLKSTAKYHFLKTGKPNVYYEFLLPIGPLKKIPDGLYPTVLRDVILVETYKSWRILDEDVKSTQHPTIGSVPIGFALDHRIFFHRTTISHDLWSLLAELIFRQLIHAPQIKSRITDGKHEFALYYLACKAKKRYQVRGNASIEKLAEDFSHRFSRENPRGDLEDLAQAAIYFNFSYTVIGLDSRGNFFWRDYVSQHVKGNGPYLAFFVKTTADKTMFWYALEDVGRSCPKERRLYHDVQNGDLQQWGGKFYFHSAPAKVSSFISKQPFSSRNLLKASTRIFSQATKWVGGNFGKLRLTLAATLSAVSFRTRSALQSVFGFFTIFRKTQQKVYPKKNIEALYVRNQP